jgi:hypothetical protein
MRAGWAPRSTMLCTSASTTPVTAPRQPAWAAPMTRASGSASRTGAQSAVPMPRATPGRVVTMASTRGRAFSGHGFVTSTTSALWI